jgi:FkbM family methyltransferase
MVEPDARVLYGANRYGRYCIPEASRDRPVAQAVLNGRIWERRTVSFLCGVEGSIVHAGTFFGDFLPALAENHRVWAFEPNTESYRCAVKTVELNGLDVTLRNAALGAERGEGLLAVTRPDGHPIGGGSHLVDRPGQTEEVSILTIDEAVEGHIGAIQLDVEGHEQQALMGALETIKRCQPVILVETLPERDWLLSIGYEQKGVLDANFLLGPIRSRAPLGPWLRWRAGRIKRWRHHAPATTCGR